MASPNTTFTTGQVLTSAQANNFPFGVISRKYDTAATLNNSSTAVQSFMSATAFTPVAGRLYRCTYSIGAVTKITNNGNIDITMRKDSTAGAVLNTSVYSALFGIQVPFSTSILLTSTEMGTSSFTPFVCVQVNTVGLNVFNSATSPGTILFEDIGLA